jgi:hypothetical protein
VLFNLELPLNFRKVGDDQGVGREGRRGGAAERL